MIYEPWFESQHRNVLLCYGAGRNTFCFGALLYVNVVFIQFRAERSEMGYIFERETFRRTIIEITLSE